ncbi:arabinan endo-1,5-alpha-L-arabinosidase [Marinactinospora thermotolerans]|uniref:Arabinan endo-1,5-alpha-L-arabinosidase n=1 Tax=Marinactinospora thermotolerans DSM 45154 TaxID=1122192 RepID=A0A1T4LRU0_9ACTN|nr:arabinan endo-1,5-alpha-L-arabinosidase [Marinactinospora thermotolerans]SJZ57164.1 arabinan endo-1,5-alpha-L-arabinosidase [Marinactinospora thermotolerans DSM 45154]
MKRRFLTTAAALAAAVLTVSPLAPAHAAPQPRAADRLDGDVRVHDPALVKGEAGEDWYVFSTGDPAVGDGNIQIRSSPDGRTWTYEGTVWADKPAWLAEEIPGVTNLWAPEVYEHDGTYYLYYSASTFGSNRSLIGLATNTTLDPRDPDYAWIDRGKVTESFPGDDYNAIDPGVVEDAEGTPWMAFGSFWSGIRMLRLHWPDGKPAAGQGEPLRIADRGEPPNAIEAPYIVERHGWYYLFVSLDSCCQGSASTYRIAVGRSRAVTGPYHDRDGRPLLAGGGTVILASSGSRIGPGGQSVSGGYLAYHYYDADAGGDFRLGLRPLRWSPDGWPQP